MEELCYILHFRGGGDVGLVLGHGTHVTRKPTGPEQQNEKT